MNLFNWHVNALLDVDVLLSDFVNETMVCSYLGTF